MAAGAGMRMQSSDGARRGRRAAAGVLAALAGCLLAGCTAGGVSHVSQALAVSGSGGAATVAFESIEGPPPAVFNHLIEHLSNEAQTRRVAIVSRDASANYRIRGYMAAHAERGRVVIGWVWDVYDTEKRRSLRIAGEEGAGARRPAEAWQAADEGMIRKIARTSMDRLVAFLGGAEPSSEPVPAAPEGPAVAAAPMPNVTALADPRAF